MLNRLFFILALTWTAHAAAAATAVEPAAIEKLDAFFQQHLEHIRTPGFAVSVSNRDGLIWSRGYGVTVYEGDEPVTADSIMAIGSLTKSFTAMAILQLEEQGLLSVDDLVTDHLPWFRSAEKSVSDRITLRMCLNNTTGLKPSFNILTRNLSRSPQALENGIRALSSYRSTREPGESYEYFNEGWNTLGLVIEEVTGLAYEDYIAEHILKPLQMSRTSTDREVLESWPVLTGHHAGINPNPSRFIHVQGSLPAGSGLYSTVNDLSNYLVALMNGGEFEGARVLTPQSIENMWQPAIPTYLVPWELGGNREPAHYAMGYFVLDVEGIEYVGHGGEFRTMSSLAFVDRENDLALALLYNTGSLDAYSNQKHYYALIQGLRIAAGLEPNDFGLPRQPDPTLNDFVPAAEQAEALLGTYVTASGRRLDLRPGGSEGLHAFQSDGIYPADFDVDFVNSSNIILRNIMESFRGSFQTDASGAVASLTFNGETYGRRLPPDTEGMRPHRSDASPFTFALPEAWKVQWRQDGFVASAGDRQIEGRRVAEDFDSWKASRGMGDRPPGPAEMRNGYYFQTVMTRAENAQRLALHTTHSGSNYLLELQTPDGEMTYAIIDVLNPFLDSLNIRQAYESSLDRP